jgi:hypothetical protein
MRKNGVQKFEPKIFEHLPFAQKWLEPSVPNGSHPDLCGKVVTGPEHRGPRLAAFNNAGKPNRTFSIFQLCVENVQE